MRHISSLEDGPVARTSLTPDMHVGIRNSTVEDSYGTESRNLQMPSRSNGTVGRQYSETAEFMELRNTVKELEMIVSNQGTKLADIEEQIQEIWELSRRMKITTDTRRAGNKVTDENSRPKTYLLENPNHNGLSNPSMKPSLTPRINLKSTTPTHRASDKVTLHVTVDVYMESVKILSHIYAFNASTCKTLGAFWHTVSPCVAESLAEQYTSSMTNRRFSEDFLKWADTTLTLEEDGNVATMNITPTRPTNSCFPELTYDGWYLRNVLRGRNEGYDVDIKVSL